MLYIIFESILSCFSDVADVSKLMSPNFSFFAVSVTSRYGGYPAALIALILCLDNNSPCPVGMVSALIHPHPMQTKRDTWGFLFADDLVYLFSYKTWNWNFDKAEVYCCGCYQVHCRCH